MYNLLEISNKILKEGYLKDSEYPDTDRIEDINEENALLKEEAGQIGSMQGIADSGNISEEFTLVAEDNVFTRTIPNIGIRYVQYKETVDAQWIWLDLDTRPGHNRYFHLDMRFIADEKGVEVRDARAGFIKVTYERPAHIEFTVDNLTDDPVPSPDWLPEEFRPLLWLGPILKQKIADERRDILTPRYNRIKQLFDNHYERFATQYSEIRTEESNDRR